MCQKVTTEKFSMFTAHVFLNVAVVNQKRFTYWQVKFEPQILKLNLARSRIPTCIDKDKCASVACFKGWIFSNKGIFTMGKKKFFFWLVFTSCFHITSYNYVSLLTSMVFCSYILRLLCCFGKALAEEGQSQQSDWEYWHWCTQLFSASILTDDVRLWVCGDKKETGLAFMSPHKKWERTS